jgi:hypothetical protein
MCGFPKFPNGRASEFVSRESLSLSLSLSRSIQSCLVPEQQAQARIVSVPRPAGVGCSPLTWPELRGFSSECLAFAHPRFDLQASYWLFSTTSHFYPYRRRKSIPSSLSSFKNASGVGSRTCLRTCVLPGVIGGRTGKAPTAAMVLQLPDRTAHRNICVSRDEMPFSWRSTL